MVTVANAPNPAQREILDRIRATGDDDRPAFDPELRDELRAELEEGVAEVAAGLDPERPMRINKHALASVHGCEAKWLAEADEPFVVTPATARGTVVHKAVELSVHWPHERDRHPLDLVDAAVESLMAADTWVTEFLAGMSTLEQAELRGNAGEVVAKFLETWPPMPSSWWPVTETALWAELGAGRVKLRGVVDLTLGRAREGRANKAVIDLKTGGFVPGHVEDLRFYALLDTLRCGVPPRLLATYYLDAGTLQPELVTEQLLWSAVARTVDGVRRIAELRAATVEPTRRPSPACRWCSLRDGCEPGQGFLADDDPR